MQILKKQFVALTISASVIFSFASTVVAEKTIKLTPANTEIHFIGSHVVDKKPDPEARKGAFEKLSGSATLVDGKLTSISVDITTTSVATGNGKLDGHLKSPDFFSVRQYPKASFSSTKIESTDAGKVKITGKLKLLKETKTISFPATVKSQDGLTLKAEFLIDRSQFGMNYGLEKIDKDVEMMISVEE